MRVLATRLATALLLGAVAVWPLPSRAGETIEILLAHDQLQVPANTTPAILAAEFRAQADRMSNGRIKVDILPNAMLGGNLDVVRLVEKNVVHSALTPIGAVAAVYPPLRATVLPFSFDRIETARKVMNGGYRQRLANDMSASVNLQLLGFADAGGFDILTNLDREIGSPDDMWGLNIASFPDLPELDAMIKATGAKAVKVSMREKINALTSHALDGQTGTADMALAQGLPAIQGHATLTNHLYAPYVWVFSKEALEAMEPADRAIIMKAAETALAKALEHAAADERAQTPLKALRQNMSVRVLLPAEREAFKSVMLPAAQEALTASLGADGERLIKEFKAAIRAAEGR
jgi:TRAP-type C4-dicarboxylate transport system substrate-binding protein